MMRMTMAMLGRRLRNIVGRPRCMATSPASQYLPDTPFSRFLQKDSGLSQSEIGAVYKRFEGHFKYRAMFRLQNAYNLLHEAGLSPHQAIKVLMKPNVAKDTADTKQLSAKLRLIRSLGVSNEFTSRTIVQCPQILSSKFTVDTDIIASLKGIFGSKKELADALHKSPRLLLVHNNVRPCLEVLGHLGFNAPQLLYLVRSNPSLLTRTPQALHSAICALKSKISDTTEGNGDLLGVLSSPHCFVRRHDINEVLRAVKNQKRPEHLFPCRVKTLDVLAQHGFHGDALHSLLKNSSWLLTYKEETIRDKIQYIVEGLGIALDSSEPSKLFIRALARMSRTAPSKIEEKKQCLMSFGLQAHEVNEVFRNRPELLTASLDKLRKNMTFLVHSVGWPLSVVTQNSVLLLASLEKNMFPRYLVIKHLRELKPSWRGPSLRTLVVTSEKKFLERYVGKRICSSQLMKIYREALAHPHLSGNVT